MRLKEKKLLQTFAATLKKFSAQGAKKVEYGTSTKHVSPYIVVYLDKVFATATAFQKFIFIVKYCPFTSTFAARSFSSISDKQKKILLVFLTYEYLKRCPQINFHT